MNIKAAAGVLARLIVDLDAEDKWHDADSENCRFDHIMSLLQSIIDGGVDGEKAHRWLGWTQACIVMSSPMTLEEMKIINKISSFIKPLEDTILAQKGD